MLCLLVFTMQSVNAINKHISIAPGKSFLPKSINEEINRHLTVGYVSDTLFLDFGDGSFNLQESLKFYGNYPERLNAPIVVRGAGKVVFSGSKILNNKLLKPISNKKIKNLIICKDAQSKVLELDLTKNGVRNLGEIKCIGFGRNAGIAPPQLFHNGGRMTLARYPNAGDPNLLKNRTTVIPIKKIANKGLHKVELPLDESVKSTSTGTGGSFFYTDSRIEKWTSAKDVWLDGIFSRDWSWSLNKVSKIDTEYKTITLGFDEKYDLTAEHSFFFACNLLEEIDVPGEYFMDRTSGKLYFYPPTDFSIKTSQLELSNNPQDFIVLKKVNNVLFENVSFEFGRLRAASIIDCKNVVFRKCEFRNFGISALFVKGVNNRIENCSIHSIGGTAITLDGGNFETLEKANNTVKDCEIYDWAYYNRVYTPAIALSGVGNNVIGNKMYDAPHGAITISGNDHKIEHNEISNVLLEFADFGAIYAFLGKNQLMRGDTIRGNYFHDIGALGDRVYAVYADEATVGWTIDNNLFYKIGNKGSRIAAVYGNTCTYTKVTNNLFLDCNETFDLSFHFSTWGKKRLDYFTKEWLKQYGEKAVFPPVYVAHYPELKSFMNDERVFVNTNSFIGNAIGNFSIPLSHKNYFTTRNGPSDSDKYVISKDNLFIDDPSLPIFLEKWNKTSDKKSLNDSIPQQLVRYLRNTQ
ncbi:MAG: right-handed parallel beta-helix repeat-containing protein [Bacteroidia bacterium]|nr:right-handed parallel beta-helix repeat-containing protein [Bacteroidia bacterium]